MCPLRFPSGVFTFNTEKELGGPTGGIDGTGGIGLNI